MPAVLSVLVFAALAVAVGALLSFPAMLLWNEALVPAIPMLQEVSLLQMFGIVILCRILFSSTVNVNK